MSEPLDIVSVVGARPQFIKLAPVCRALAQSGQVNHRIAHTGQHYDERMSGMFFEQLDIPKPDVDLGIGSASHAAQTAAMLTKLEEWFLQLRPDAVLVYGDTNSTLAATLAATKINIPVAHIEAGLRSFNRSMPEEINRVTADHCSDRLYVPTLAGMKNLANENLDQRSVLSGDVMRDAVAYNRKRATEQSQILDTLDLRQTEFGVLTLHRPVNTTKDALYELLSVLNKAALKHLPLVFPVHPRTQAMLDDMNDAHFAGIKLIEPLAYLDMLQMTEAATVVLTDSGGLQKEAAFLSTRCITLREETEWTETVDMGVNCLVGRDQALIHQAYEKATIESDPFNSAVSQEMDQQYGCGDAAEMISRDLISWLSEIDHIGCPDH